jgi:hypothetical protein
LTLVPLAVAPPTLNADGSKTETVSERPLLARLGVRGSGRSPAGADKRKTGAVQPVLAAPGFILVLLARFNRGYALCGDAHLL